MKVKPNIPEWFKKLPDKAALGSKDVSVVLGYKDDSGLHKAMTSGRFPVPDFKDYRKCNNGGRLYHYWRVSTIRGWLNVNRPTK